MYDSSLGSFVLDTIELRSGESEPCMFSADTGECSDIDDGVEIIYEVFISLLPIRGGLFELSRVDKSLVYF